MIDSEERFYQLPIEHPDYQYRPASNPYWKKIRTQSESLALTDQETEQFAGQWRTRFLDSPASTASLSPPRELHVELGCNAGHVTVEWAKANPQHAYVGIDWKFKPIFRAAEKAHKLQLQNLLFFRAHSERLHYMFGPGEIDALYLFFPDPWPKKAHFRNRYVTAARLRNIALAVRPGGLFHIKTDHPGYFEWMLEAIAEVVTQHESTPPCWKILSQTRDLHLGHPDPTRLQIPEVTLFEKLFIKDGIPIQSIQLQRL